MDAEKFAALKGDAELARDLGLAPADVRALRQEMREGVDWQYVGRKVMWNQCGLEKLRKKLATGVEDQEWENRQERLLVYRAGEWVKNPGVVLCYRQDTDPTVPANQIRVMVKSNVNFRPRLFNGQPMALEARLESDGKWRLVGRCPRWPGKW